MQITNTLNYLVRAPVTNHLFFPTGGGEDLKSVGVSAHETGCIELTTGGTTLMRPLSLEFVQVGDKNELSYFRLEGDDLEPCGVYAHITRADEREEVTQLRNGKYVERSVADEGIYLGSPIHGFRAVVRHFGGSFVIFAKGSFYNTLRGMGIDAYNARHNKMSAREFRDHVLAMFEKLNQAGWFDDPV